MSSKLSRREFLRLGTLASGAVLLAACSPTPPAATQAPAQEPADQEPAEQAPAEEAPAEEAPVEAAAPASVEIRYAMWDWYAYAGVEWDVWNQEEAFPRFQEENPDITLTWEPLGDGWEDKVLTQMAAGTAPDIISVWSPSLETWAEKEQLLDLQPLVDADFPDADTRFIGFAWEQMWNPYKQIRMAMLADLDITSLYYDKRAFDEAGVDYPSLEWDVADYTQAATALTVADASGSVTRWGGQLRPDFWTGYCHYIEAWGGEVRDEETGMECRLDGDLAIEALEWCHSGMFESNCFGTWDQTAATGVPNLWSGALPAGILASAERSADQFFDLAANMPEGAWDIAHVPSVPGGGRQCMGLPDEWAVYNGVVERGNMDATWSFLKWLSSGWYQEQIAAVAGRIPGEISAVETWADSLRAKDARLGPVTLEVLTEQIEMGYPKRTPTFRFQQVAEELINAAMESIFIEGNEPASILTDLAPAVTAAQQEALAREQS